MKNIVIAVNLNASTGRDKVIGALKYIRNRADWNIRIMSCQDLPALLGSAQSADLSGLIASYPPDGKLTKVLAALSLPMVLFELPKKQTLHFKAKTSLMQSDNDAVGRLGAEHLLSLGRFSAYAFVMPDQPFGWANDRLAAFQTVISKAGHPVCVFPPADDEDLAVLKQWVKGLPKPAAIMAATDKKALDVIHACHAEGLSIPDNVAVLGVDNDALYCTHITPPLSSIQLNCEEQGFLAAKELARLMSSSRPSKGIKLCKVPPVGLRERETTAPLSPSVRLVERAMSFIRENACSGIRVPDVVAYLGVSRRLADKRFREITSSSIAVEINNVRMFAVRQAIRKGETSPRKIAATCGFRNVKYLQNLFRAREGKTIRTATRKEGEGGRRR